MDKKRKAAGLIGFLGKHLLLELKECDREIINNLDKVRNAMVSAARRAKARVVEEAFHEFNPHGISGMVVIAESHLSIHTWPEYHYAAVDIFTCGELIDPQVAANYLVKKFKSKDHSFKEIKRGILPLKGALRLKHKP